MRPVHPSPAAPARFAACGGAALLLVGALAAPAPADVVVTRDGLTLEGEVTRRPDGRLEVRTGEGTVLLEGESVAAHRPGPGPRARARAALADLAADDVAGRYRLAVTLEAEGAHDVAREVLAEVLRLEPEHAAARRALGFEKVEGRWLTRAQARRAQGLVLYGGTWMLPAEVEAASRAAAASAPEAPARDAARVVELLRTLALGAPALRPAARVALAEAPAAMLLAGGLKALYDRAPEVRIEAARLLGDLGDEGALRALVFSGVRDVDSRVRREAVLAAQALGHDDTAVPFVRALGSENLQLVAHAAEALERLGDERAAGYIVRRLESHGSSTRNYVSFLNQISYVRDYDVEIAQASNIANPDVATLLEGVVLDVRVLDAAYTRTWVEPILVKAYAHLVGEPLETREQVRAHFLAHGRALPEFPREPRRERAPRRPH